MKKEKGITLVSLVVTIIILIILAGVSINLTLGKNGIITIAKQAKENTELAKIEEETTLNELYMQIEAEGGISGNISYDIIAKLTEFKTAIANYIEEAGGVKPETTADATTFGESIKGILKEVTKDATATSEDIAEGKTAWVKGTKITGTKSNSKLNPPVVLINFLSSNQLYVVYDLEGYDASSISLTYRTGASNKTGYIIASNEGNDPLTYTFVQLKNLTNSIKYEYVDYTQDITGYRYIGINYPNDDRSWVYNISFN